MARPAVAVALLVALLHVRGQEFPPPPPPDTTMEPTDAPLPTTMMDFGSIGSSDGATDGPDWFTPTPTIDTGSLNIDWTWNGSYAGSGSSGSGSSWHYDGDEAGVEIIYPGIDGAVEAAIRRKYEFNASKGFSVITTTLNETHGIPEKCNGSAYCVELVFESDYGAMSSFDAFVLDRYESAGGPVEFEDAVRVGGAVPLVLGRMSSEDLGHTGTNWSDVFNWNETRRTSWVIKSPTLTKPIDVTLSLKQLYTLLPGYDTFSASNDTADGPFYSEDTTDQVIIRVNAHVPSLFAGDSIMLPLVVNHTGSRLFQVNMTSALLYNGNGVNGGNAMRITFALSRRRYGGSLPWFPARPSAECKRCQEEVSLPDEFNECLEDALNRKSLVFEDLLAFTNDRVSFDMEPYAEQCFASIADGNWSKDANASMVPMPMWNGTEYVTVYVPSNKSSRDPWEILRRTDAALRCMAESQCSIDGGTLKADAQVVVLKHSPALTHIEFGEPDYSFYLQLGLENATDDEIITTQVFNNWTSAEELARAIALAFPNATEMNLDIEVKKYNNTEEITAIEEENQRLIKQYEDALKWTGVYSRSTGGSDGEGSEAGSWSSNSSSSADGSASTGAVQPQPPILQHVPAETYTIEIISHNVTIVLHVVAVFSGSRNVSHYSLDNTLTFEVAPLDVSKFEYVPPPSHLDLDWDEEPAWAKAIRSKSLPFFESNDTCGQCMSLYEACLLRDPDCAFGVNEYLAEAFRRERFTYTTSKVYDPVYDAWPMKYSVDISGALNESQKFFPGGGFAKFERLLNCWAATSCDLDMPRGDMVFEKSIRAAATRLNVSESRLELLVRKDAIGYKTVAFTFPGEGRPSYWYKIMEDPIYLQQFIRDSVFLGSNQSIVRAWKESVTDMDIRYVVTWFPSANASSGFVFSEDPTQVKVTYTHGRMAIETIRHKPLSTVDTVPQWARLTEWLNVFQYAPFGNRHPLNDTNPDISRVAPSSAICDVCSKALFACTSSAGCMSSMNAWLPTIMGEADFTSLKYIRRFKTEALNSDTNIPPDCRVAALNLLQCLAANACAVGYSGAGTSATQWTTVAPTTVHMDGSFSLLLPVGSSVRLMYKTMVTDTLQSGTDFGEALKMLRVYPMVSRHFSDSESAHVYTFSGDISIIKDISVVELVAPAFTTAVSFSGWLESPWPMLPSWENLHKWFNLSSTNTANNNDVCSSCLPSIQKCYTDADCWRSVQEVVLPQINSLPTSNFFDEANGRTIFRAELGHVLFQNVLNSPVANAFTTSGSWENFASILQCFAASHCDTETMTSAVEPPATAHIPSFIYTKGASVQLYLYMDSEVQLTFEGQTFTYMETGSRLVNELSAFLETSFGTLGIPHSVSLASTGDATNTFVYTITFDEKYLGRLPVFALTSNGAVTGTQPPYVALTPWQITIESINQPPMWDKLTRLLSLVPVDPTAAPAINCEVADSYRRACLFNANCQYMLTSAARPAILKALDTTTAEYNPASGRFEVDVTALLLSQVLPLAETDRVAQGLLMNTIYSSTSCAAASGAVLTPSDFVSLNFEDSRVQFSRPATGPLTVDFDGQTFTIHDEDPQVGEQGLINMLTENVVARSQSDGAVTVVRVIADGEIHYDVRFPRVFNIPPPHFSWTNPDSGARIDSTDSPWRVVFRSSGYSVRDAFQPWLLWFGSSP